MKKKVYFIVWNLIKEGKTLKQVSQQLELSKQALNKYVRRLKRSGSIKKIGYGVWEAQEFNEKEVNLFTPCRSKKEGGSNKKFTSFKEIRGHAFVFRLKIPKLQNWHRRIEYLEKNNIGYKDLGLDRIRIFLDKNKVWLCNNSIVFYLHKGLSYFADNAENSENACINDFVLLINKLETLLKASLQINKQYKFRVSRHHFSRIRDSLAQICNQEKKKLNIKLDNGWFVIDNSFQLNEAETQGKEAVKYMDNNYKPFIESLMKQPFRVEEFIELKTEYYRSMTILTQQIQAHLLVVSEIREYSKIANKVLIKLDNKLSQTNINQFGRYHARPKALYKI